MRFLPPEEPVTLYETGFEDDLLGRVRVSISLSDVLERIEDPLVIALDGRWGTGKTYFLKRWVGAHRNDNEGKALTLYFDAFAHDYLSDPLIALVGALSSRLPPSEKSKVDKVKSFAVKLMKPAAHVGLSIATFGATEALSDMGDAAVDAFKNEADKALEDFWKREEGREAAMRQFRSAIEALTKGDRDDEITPLIIVIDELDRCRPDYALELLEVVKHFFSVPHVHFVLGVNLKALENSVKARYGAEIDATAYLQKFLSFTIDLPTDIGDENKTPTIAKYLDNLYGVIGLPKLLFVEIRTQLKILSKANDISIRDVGKIISSAAILPDEAQNDNVLVGYRTVLVTLIITKIIKPHLFWKLLKGAISEDEFLIYFGATEENINSTLPNGGRNPNYDVGVVHLCAVWHLVLGNLVNNGNFEWPNVSEYFNYRGTVEDLKDVPLYVYDRWISVFNRL